MSDLIVNAIIVGTGVSLLPLFVDLCKALCPKMGVARLTSALLQPILLTFVVVLSLLALNMFFTTFLPYSHLKDEDNTPRWTWRYCCHVFFALWAWVNVVFNFAATILAGPGGRSHPAVAAIVARAGAAADNTCARCASSPPKPTEMSHCRACKDCVFYMDHHCPFTGGCIGANNFIYFILFLGYCTLGLIYAAALSARPFADCVFGQAPEALAAACAALGTRSVIFLPTAAGVVTVGSLFIMHFVLYWFGRTTVQFCTAFSDCAGWTDITTWKRALGRTAPTQGVRPASAKLWELRHGLRWWQLLMPVGVPGNRRPQLSALMKETAPPPLHSAARGVRDLLGGHNLSAGDEDTRQALKSRDATLRRRTAKGKISGRCVSVG